MANRRMPDRRRRPDREEPEEPAEDKPGIKKVLWDIAKDVMVAAIVMAVVIGSMYAYTGNWPPLVVVQSGSMMHGDDSSLGVIDTGDLVLVKEVSGREDVVSYFEGERTGHRTYGGYGDVIVYKKDGLAGTPVIHRALMWVEVNETTGRTFDLVDVDDEQLAQTSVVTVYDQPRFDDGVVPGEPLPSIYNVNEVVNFGPYGYDDNELIVDFSNIYDNMLNRSDFQSGFLTLGDHNTVFLDGKMAYLIDQETMTAPVKVDWIIGKARGELPWFGLIKLYISHDITDINPAPTTSKWSLAITIVVLITVPFVIDFLLDRRAKRKKELEDAAERDAGPGGRRLGGGRDGQGGKDGGGARGWDGGGMRGGAGDDGDPPKRGFFGLFGRGGQSGGDSPDGPRTRPGRQDGRGGRRDR